MSSSSRPFFSAFQSFGLRRLPRRRVLGDSDKPREPSLAYRYSRGEAKGRQRPMSAKCVSH